MESIRRKAARWASDHLARLKSAIPEVSDALNDRARDLWRPLQAIADAVGGGQNGRDGLQRNSQATLRNPIYQRFHTTSDPYS